MNIKKLIPTLFSLFLLISAFKANAQTPPGGCIAGCSDPDFLAANSFSDYCSCIQAFPGCNTIEDPDANQPCIPVNTNSWTLIVLGFSLVVVGYMISKRSKV